MAVFTSGDLKRTDYAQYTSSLTAMGHVDGIVGAAPHVTTLIFRSFFLLPTALFLIAQCGSSGMGLQDGEEVE